MKNMHRNAHKLAWLLILPFLLWLILYALDGRFDIEQRYGESQIAVDGEELP